MMDVTRLSRDVNNRSNRDNSDSDSDGDNVNNSDVSAMIKAEIAEWIRKDKEEGLYQASTVTTEVDLWL